MTSVCVFGMRAWQFVLFCVCMCVRLTLLFLLFLFSPVMRLLSVCLFVCMRAFLPVRDVCLFGFDLL